jgi:tetrahydromethanopterin S-methyltransferase subunit C
MRDIPASWDKAPTAAMLIEHLRRWLFARGELALAAAFCLYAAAFLVLAWPWISGAVTIPWDAKAQSQPSLQFLANSFARGESPFWTPNIYLGWPQIADPQSLIFSPIHLALAFFDKDLGDRAADAATFAALFCGGLGVILFFHERGWRSAGALVAAIAFAFGGVAAARVQHTNEILSLSYFPLALWLLERALGARARQSSWRYGALAGVFLGLMACDRDQVAMLLLYVCCGFVLAHWFAARPSPKDIAKPVVAAAAVTACIAIVPVVLTALLAAASNRPAIAYDVAVTGSLHPALLLTLAIGDLFSASTAHYWGPPSGAWDNTGLVFAQNMGELYQGALPFVALIGLGLIRRQAWSHEMRFFALALAAALLYALGGYTPIFHWMFDIVPGVALWRRPADAAFVIGALIAIIAGYLVHRVLTDPDERSRPQMTRPQIAIAAAIAAGILTCSALLAFLHGRLDEAASPMCIDAIAAALATSLLVLSRRLRHYPLIPALALVAFMTVDLAWHNGPTPSTGVAPAVYDAMRPDTANATVAIIKSKLKQSAAPDRRDRVELIGLGYHWPNIGLVHDFDHVFGQNPLRLQEFALATGVGDTVAAPSQRPFSPLYPSYRSTFADLLGVRYIATGVPVERIDKSLQPRDLAFIARTADGYVYENPRALPRVMVVPGWQLVDFDDLIRHGWPDADPRQTVLLDQAPAQPAPASPRQPDGSAEIASYKNTDVIVDVTAPSGGFLLLSDIWHPWWRAEVDGKAAPILRADVLLRAIQLTPGRHHVEFRFDVLGGVLHEIEHKLGFV